jgi:hypothetical protein
VGRGQEEHAARRVVHVAGTSQRHRLRHSLGRVGRTCCANKPSDNISTIIIIIIILLLLLLI